MCTLTTFPWEAAGLVSGVNNCGKILEEEESGG